MIKTQDLIEFIRKTRLESISSLDHQGQEYYQEIVARLKAFDKLRESIEKVCHNLSNRVDK